MHHLQPFSPKLVVLTRNICLALILHQIHWPRPQSGSPMSQNIPFFGQKPSKFKKSLSWKFSKISKNPFFLSSVPESTPRNVPKNIKLTPWNFCVFFLKWRPKCNISAKNYKSPTSGCHFKKSERLMVPIFCFPELHWEYFWGIKSFPAIIFSILRFLL